MWLVNSLDHRIRKYFRLQGTSGDCLVQPPASVVRSDQVAQGLFAAGCRKHPKMMTAEPLLAVYSISSLSSSWKSISFCQTQAFLVLNHAFCHDHCGEPGFTVSVVFWWVWGADIEQAWISPPGASNPSLWLWWLSTELAPLYKYLFHGSQNLLWIQFQECSREG